MIQQAQAERFFSDCLDVIQTQARGAQEDLVIDSHVVRLEFFSQELRQALLPAVAHLRRPFAGNADLIVHMIDSASARTSLPACPWKWEEGIRGSLLFQDERFSIYYQADFGLLSLIDMERACAIYRVENGARLPLYEKAAPLKSILSRWLAGQGLCLAHGAALALDGKAVLLAGKGGAGKSSSALACLAFDKDLKYISDDFCLIGLDPHPRAHCLYSSLKVCEDMAACFPDMPKGFFEKDYPQPKSMVYVPDYFPDRLCATAQIKALLLPRVGQAMETARLSRATPAEALLALAPSSMLIFSNRGPSVLAPFAQLVRQLPAYWLDICRNTHTIPSAIREALNS